MILMAISYRGHVTRQYRISALSAELSAPSVQFGKVA
jgi:hypothetical protein